MESNYKNMVKEDNYKETITRMDGTFKGVWKDIQSGKLTLAEIEEKHSGRMEFIEELVEEAAEGYELPEPEIVVVYDPTEESITVYTDHIDRDFVFITRGEEFNPMTKPTATGTFDSYQELLDELLTSEPPKEEELQMDTPETL
jgi:hypothetical protein